MLRLPCIVVVAFASGLSSAAYAQGAARGAQDGAARGEAVAGPLGAAVGSAVGAVVGGANSVLGIDRRERFRIYTMGEQRPSFALRGPVHVGTVLPVDGIVYYDVPPEFALRGFNYTIVNDHAVLVEPGTRRIAEVIN